MSLISPTPGELLDRLSILELKISAFKKRAMNAEHFEAEKAGLQENLEGWDWEMRENMPVKITWDMINEQKNALAAVNAMLWAAEDEVRCTPEVEAMKLARLAKHISKMNDARAKAIKRLNEIYGADAGPEKLYQYNFVSDETLGVE